MLHNCPHVVRMINSRSSTSILCGLLPNTALVLCSVPRDSAGSTTKVEAHQMANNVNAKVQQ